MCARGRRSTLLRARATGLDSRQAPIQAVANSTRRRHRYRTAVLVPEWARRRRRYSHQLFELSANDLSVKPACRARARRDAAFSAAPIIVRRRHSSAVEQLFRKQQVLGSNPSVGSTPVVRIQEEQLSGVSTVLAGLRPARGPANWRRPANWTDNRRHRPATTFSRYRIEHDDGAEMGSKNSCLQTAAVRELGFGTWESPGSRQTADKCMASALRKPTGYHIPISRDQSAQVLIAVSCRQAYCRRAFAPRLAKCGLTGDRNDGKPVSAARPRPASLAFTRAVSAVTSPLAGHCHPVPDSVCEL
jgi:hypothetical protein